MNKHHIIYIVFIFIGITFYLLNFYTPLQHDDFLYMYSYGPSLSDRPSYTRISSFWEIFQSQYYHYQMVHGRFFSHVLIQVFCALFDKYIFDIFNTFIFLLGIFFIRKYISTYTYSQHKECVILLYITTLLYFFIPDFGCTVLWLSGAVNYLWSSIFALWFITTMNKDFWLDKYNKTIVYTLIFFISLCINWMQESTSIGLCLSYTIYFFYNPSYYKRHRIPLFLGLILGTILLVLAPSNFIRAQSENIIENKSIVSLFIGKLLNFIYFIIHSCKPLLILVFINLIYFIKKSSNYLPIIKRDKFIIGSIIGNLLFIFMLGKTDARIATGISFFSITLLAKQLTPYVASIKRHIIITATTIVFLLTIYISALSECYNYYLYNNNRVSLLSSYPKNQAFPYQPYTKNESNFVRIVNWNYNPYEVHNKIMGKYYNRTCFQALPLSIYNRYKSNNFTHGLTTLNYSTKDNLNSIMEDSENNIWIIPITPPCNIIDTKITFIENRKKEKLKSHQKIIRNLLGTLQLSQRQNSPGKSMFISKDDTCYIITEAKPSAYEIIVNVTNSDNQTYNIHLTKK